MKKTAQKTLTFSVNKGPIQEVIMISLLQLLWFDEKNGLELKTKHLFFVSSEFHDPCKLCKLSKQP